jgi:hypothetical protein
MQEADPLKTDGIDGDVRQYLSSIGHVFVDFDDDESGCVSHGVTIEGSKYFVKHVATPRGAETQARAISVHSAVQHTCLVKPLHNISGQRGPIIVYPWIDGVRLRERPKTRELPINQVLDAIYAVIDVHLSVEKAGFVSIDLYDGNMLYSDRMHLIDVDEYETSPFTLREERTKGSPRFMAPEEFQTGSILDARTTVFQLGRTTAVLLDPSFGRSLDRAPAFASVVGRATQAEPNARYPTVREFASAWLHVRQQHDRQWVGLHD